MSVKNLLKVSFLFALGILFYNCGSGKKEYSPKPTGFNRIDLPEVAYQPLKEDHPYYFEYSKSAIIQKDTFRNAEPHWIVVYYPKLNARIQFTYKQIKGDKQRLQNMIDDAFKLAFKHDRKAYSISDKLLTTKDGKKALIFELEGEVPSHYQFLVTDTTQHFLRGAVYLMTATQNDSLRPVVDYVKQDCLHLLETLKWKK